MTDTTAPLWYARIDIPGELTDEQMEQLAEGTAVLRYDSHDHIATIHLHIHADNLADATRGALTALDHLPGLQALRADGQPWQPRALTIQDEQAHAEGLRVLGAAEAAARLGVTTARLRQLNDDPAFPDPIAQPSSGKIYDPADIDHASRTINRKPGPKPTT